MLLGYTHLPIDSTFPIFPAVHAQHARKIHGFFTRVYRTIVHYRVRNRLKMRSRRIVRSSATSPWVVHVHAESVGCGQSCPKNISAVNEKKPPENENLSPMPEFGDTAGEARGGGARVPYRRRNRYILFLYLLLSLFFHQVPPFLTSRAPHTPTPRPFALASPAHKKNSQLSSSPEETHLPFGAPGNRSFAYDRNCHRLLSSFSSLIMYTVRAYVIITPSPFPWLLRRLSTVPMRRLYRRSRFFTLYRVSIRLICSTYRTVTTIGLLSEPSIRNGGLKVTRANTPHRSPKI